MKARKTVPQARGVHRTFVGREAELAALIALVDGVRAGRGAALRIEGAPGVGKIFLDGICTKPEKNNAVRGRFDTLNHHWHTARLALVCMCGKPWLLPGQPVE